MSGLLGCQERVRSRTGLDAKRPIMTTISKRLAAKRWNAVVVSSLACACPNAQSADSGARPVRLIVPFAAGGSSDLVARLLSDKLREGLNRRVIVENRAGAGGIAGTELAAQAAPDGNTMLLAYTGTFSISPNLYVRLPYDPIGDFSPVTLVTTWPYFLVVHPSLPVKSVKELIVLAVSRPGELSYGSSGNASGPHLAGALFQTMNKLNLVHVPYKGGSPALMDLLGGRLQIYFGSGPIALPHVKTGKLRMLATTSLVRSKLHSDIPTMSEAGVKRYDITSWYGIVVPAKTPRSIVDAIHKATVDVVKKPEFADALASHAIEPIYNSPAEFSALIRKEIDSYAKLVNEANVRAE